MSNVNPYKERFMKAVHYEMPDRTPFTGNDTIVGKLGDPTYEQGDNYLRPEWAMDQLIKGAKKLDADLMPMFEYCGGMNYLMPDGTRYLMPGKECPRENGTQALENNYMTDPEQYDFIIENGWKAYQEKYIDVHKTEDDEKEMARFFELSDVFAQKCSDAGLEQYDVYSSMFMINGGNYVMSMLRGFSTFLKDLRKRPDKVMAAVNAYNDSEIENYRAMNAEMPAPFEILLPNLCRTDNMTMRHDTFEKMIWPEIERYEALAAETDAILMIHVDGNYTNDIDLFTRLRPKRTVLQFDGFTDVFAIADELTKHEICVWGEIPPQMLSMGTPEEVYKRCMDLKKCMGPGIILSAGCSFPPNTKLENLLAMKEASMNMNF